MASVSRHCRRDSNPIQTEESRQTIPGDVIFSTIDETGWPSGASKILLWCVAVDRAYQSGLASMQSKNAVHGYTALYENALRVMRDLKPLHGLPSPGKMAVLALGLWICRLSLLSMAFRLIWYLLGFVAQSILIGCIAYFIIPRNGRN